MFSFKSYLTNKLGIFKERIVLVVLNIEEMKIVGLLHEFIVGSLNLDDERKTCVFIMHVFIRV